MSKPIDPSKVKAVLLSDGHWYQCESFELDVYEYVDADYEVLGFSMKATQGASLTTKKVIAGPITSVMAIETEA